MTIEIEAAERYVPNSKLPSVAAYHEVTGLEAMTGADMLVHPYKRLPSKLRDITPHRVMLAKRCDEGLLVQRKSGGDLIGSLGKLKEIVYRMKQWSPNPWLLVTRVYRNNHGKVSVRGSRRSYGHIKWENVRGAYDWWQIRGGSVAELYDDQAISRWLEWAEATVERIRDEPEIDVVHKIPQQTVNRAEPNWVNTGRAWPPGIGEKLLANLARYVSGVWGRPPTLANCMALAHSEEVKKVPLWGAKRLGDTRQWTGSGGELTVLNGQMYEAVRVQLGTGEDPVELSEGDIVLKGDK